jgi:tRNA (adenine37-N6)-methyltransferase
MTIELNPIGTVVRDGDTIQVRLEPAYHAGLKDLDTFSHVIVYWWAQNFDAPEYRQTVVVPLPYADDREAGVFACRAPLRPNLIMSTVCEIVRVDGGTVTVGNIDAFDGTPVIDLKPYFPVVDRVKDAHISSDLVGWPEWLPADGIGLEEYEVE